MFLVGTKASTPMSTKFSPFFSRRKPPDAADDFVPNANGQVTEADLEQQLHALWPALRAYATSLLGGDRSSVEDTLQETALHIWQNKHELPEIRNFQGWVFRITYFKALSCYRDRKCDRMIAFEPDVMERIADAAADVLADGGNDHVEVLADCLKHLNTADRDLLAWRYEHGHSLTILAEKLGKTADSIHQRISRLRRSLRLCMEKKISPASFPPQ